MGNKYIKYKRLQNMGRKSRAVLVPFLFLKALGWDKNTKLAIAVNPINKELHIKEVGKWEEQVDEVEI